MVLFFFNDTATTEIYTLSLHDALPIWVGQAVEVKNSVIGDGSKVPHLSYVGDSVIGEDCNLGAGTVIANLKHEKSNVKSMIKGKIIDTGRRKFGASIGDNVKTAINTSIYPGRKLFPDTTTLPGEVVKKDKVLANE